MLKASLMISSVSFILTLIVSVNNCCKLRSWILKEPFFPRRSANVELWSWYTIYIALTWMRLHGYLNFDWETSKQLEHEKIGILWKHEEDVFFAHFKSLYDILKIVLEFFNYIFFFYYNLVSVSNGYSLIFESLVK